MVQALNAPHSELRTVREVVLEFVPGRASGGMVDALASGASARKGVEVQLLSRARVGSPSLQRWGILFSPVLARSACRRSRIGSTDAASHGAGISSTGALNCDWYSSW